MRKGPSPAEGAGPDDPVPAFGLSPGAFEQPTATSNSNASIRTETFIPATPS
jgi:hypothetical protein